MTAPKKTEEEVLENERYALLEQIEDWLEVPVILLGFAWLGLLVVELLWGLTPLLETLVFVIWGIFVVDFALRFVLAPNKGVYLRNNWLTVISLLVPALRVFRVARVVRVLRVARATRSLNLVKLVGSLNRGMRALRASMGRRGFGYVVLLTIAVTLVGAAGMFAFESGQPGGEPISDYGDALWWTAMVMVTMGTDFWPQTVEGRMLGFLLSLYAFAVFGYVTATLATFFIGREAESEEAELPSATSIAELRAEIQALRSELRTLSDNRPEV